MPYARDDVLTLLTSILVRQIYAAGQRLQQFNQAVSLGRASGSCSNEHDRFQPMHPQNAMSEPSHAMYRPESFIVVISTMPSSCCTARSRVKSFSGATFCRMAPQHVSTACTCRSKSLCNFQLHKGERVARWWPDFLHVKA